MKNFNFSSQSEKISFFDLCGLQLGARKISRRCNDRSKHAVAAREKFREPGVLHSLQSLAVQLELANGPQGFASCLPAWQIATGATGIGDWLSSVRERTPWRQFRDVYSHVSSSDYRYVSYRPLLMLVRDFERFLLQDSVSRCSFVSSRSSISILLYLVSRFVYLLTFY